MRGAVALGVAAEAVPKVWSGSGTTDIATAAAGPPVKQKKSCQQKMVSVGRIIV